MSLDDFTAADDPGVDPPYTGDEVALADWPTDTKVAWRVFHEATRGDEVLWGNRKQPLTVTDVDQDSRGLYTLEVEGPRGGTYTIRERYDDNGNPRFYADDSKTMDLRFATGTAEGPERFSESMYQGVVQNLVRASVNTYVQDDYSTYDAAVSDVVQSWVKSVEFQQWSGWPYDWDDDDPTLIYRSILEHSGRFPENDVNGESTTPKSQAEEALQMEVLERGRDQAAEQLIRSEADYDAIVQELAEDAIDRNDTSVHLDAREAARNVVENFVDQNPDGIHRAIIQYGESEPMEVEMYDDLPPQQISKEMALDVLDQDVWSEARSYHQARGTHDPTIRGLAFYEYDQLVETLVEDCLREHAISDKPLWADAKKVVQEFADDLDNYEWNYDFGGLDERALDEQDVEDVYISITTHSEFEAQIYNPFVRDTERRTATQVLTRAVHERASNTLDRQEMAETDAVPADEYLQDELGVDITYNDIRDDISMEPHEWIRKAVEGMDGDDWSTIAGWTFVDELVEECNASVPYLSDEWLLVDYGIVRTDSTRRKLAWFNRDNGMVLVIDGDVSNPPDRGYTFEDFAVYTLDYGGDAPNYHLREASLKEAFTFCQEFVGESSADVLFVEDANGDHYLKESITEDDLNTSSMVPKFASGFSLPGPDFETPDIISGAERASINFGRWLRENSSLVDSTARMATMLMLGEVSRVMFKLGFDGMNIEPDFDKQHGVGITGGTSFGKDPDEVGVTGRIDANVYVTPESFRRFGEAITEDWMYEIGPEVQSLQRATEKFLGLTAMPKAIFLASHLPKGKGRGRPESTTGDKFARQRADGETGSLVRRQFGDKTITRTWSYDLDVGKTLDEETIERYLQRIELYGVAFTDRRDIEATDIGKELRGENEPEAVFDLKLPEPQFYELGWSLGRDHIFGRGGLTAAGDEGMVEEGVEQMGIIGTDREINNGPLTGQNGGPVISHRQFVKCFSEFPNTPSVSMLDTVWQYYKERAIDRSKAREGEFDSIEELPDWMQNEDIAPEDLDEEEREAVARYDPEYEDYVVDTREPREEPGFTLLDALNRFEMGLVYDLVGQQRDDAIRTVLNTALRGGQFNDIYEFDDRAIEEYGFGNLSGVEADPKMVLNDADVRQRVYIWQITNDELQVKSVFSGVDSVPDYIVFGGVNSEHQDLGEVAPPNDYWVLDDADGAYKHIVNGEVQTTRASRGGQRRVIKTGEDLYHDLTPDARKLVDALVDEQGAPDLGETGSATKFVSSRGVDWNDLDGTDLSIFGLFLRGIDMETMASAADYWDLNDRFETRLNDAIRDGAQNLRPSRPSVPSFDEWKDGRYGTEAITSLPSRATQKAKYLREVANDIPGVQSGEAQGTDPTVEEEVERMRDLRDHYKDTDYADFEQFYSDEFGNSFDDVAQKFEANRPPTESGAPMENDARPAPSAYEADETDVADGVDDPGDEPGYADLGAKDSDQ